MHQEGAPKLPSSINEGRQRIINRAAAEIKSGMNVNLGIGLPSFCATAIDPEMEVFFQSENGILGLGSRSPYEEEVDADLVNASK